MLLGDGGFSLVNIWDGESLENRVRWKNVNMPCYFYLVQGDTVHGGAMDNALTNGALRLRMHLSPGATLD